MRLDRVLVLFSVSFLAAAAGPPERKVENNVVISRHNPAVRVAVPRDACYLGADRFVLYEIADCELHVFVEADADKLVRRLYWVQFEAYLPSRPDLQHRYDSPRHATIGGLDFCVDTWVRARDEKSTPGSDEEHVRALIQAKGYRLPPAMMSVRLVHLMDEKRKELMMIFSESLDSSGLRAEDLKEGGAAYAQWPALEKGLIERAKRQFKIPADRPPNE